MEEICSVFLDRFQIQKYVFSLVPRQDWRKDRKINYRNSNFSKHRIIKSMLITQGWIISIKPFQRHEDESISFRWQITERYSFYVVTIAISDPTSSGNTYKHGSPKLVVDSNLICITFSQKLVPKAITVNPWKHDVLCFSLSLDKSSTPVPATSQACSHFQSWTYYRDGPITIYY